MEMEWDIIGPFSPERALQQPGPNENIDQESEQLFHY
jgi:hypothetical protein